MLTVLSVVGTRPEIIQAAPVTRALRGRFREVLLHTGQHYDDNMSRIFFADLQLPSPDYDLGVGSGTHGEQTAAVLLGVERAIREVRPDVVVVRGDTNSALGAALAAVKMQVRLAHVEAGTRCFNRSVPEELNRIVADHLSDVLLCPTERAVANLSAEGLSPRACWTGDVTVDSLRLNELRVKSCIARILERFGLAPGRYCFATVHRVSNVEDELALRSIVAALGRLDCPVVLPLHPRTVAATSRLGVPLPSNVRVSSPQPYVAALALVMAARACITDSGGLQKEAYLLGTPCVTLREETEWPETVEAGWNVLVGSDPDRIVEAVGIRPPANRPMFFGDGHAAERIVDVLASAVS